MIYFDLKENKINGKQEIYPFSPLDRKETNMPSSTQSPINATIDIENPVSPQNNTEEIMQSLTALMDNMRKNQSILSQMAEGWSKLPLWIKICSGLIVFGSLLIIGILTLSTFLIVTTCVCTLLYTLVSLGLDNHHATTKDEHNQLESRISNLGQFMRCIIDELSNASSKLSIEINRLSDLIEKKQVDFESELSKLKLQADASQQLNNTLRSVVQSFTACLDENYRSHTEFSENFDRHLNEMIGEKESFSQALSSLSSLENELKASLLRNEELYKKYDALVTQHQQKLDIESRKKVSIGMQTEYYAPRLLSGIITTQEERFDAPIASSQGYSY